MNNTIKGRISLNGMEIELEGASASSFAEVVNAISDVSKKRTQLLQNQIQAINNNQDIQSTRKRRVRYAHWSEHDILLIANYARQNFENNEEGFGVKMYHVLKREGETKTRSKNNVNLIANRIYRYINNGESYRNRGVNKGLNERLVNILERNGYIVAPTGTTGGNYEEDQTSLNLKYA